MIFGIGLFLAIAVTCILTFVWLLISQGLKNCIYDDDEARGIVATIILGMLIGIIVAGISCDKFIERKAVSENGVQLELEDN